MNACHLKTPPLIQEVGFSFVCSSYFTGSAETVYGSGTCIFWSFCSYGSGNLRATISPETDKSSVLSGNLIILC